MSGRKAKTGVPNAAPRRAGNAAASSFAVFAALAVISAAGLSGCLSGSETGNPAKGLTGQIRTLDGLPAARTRVVLVPEGFVPADAHASVALPAATTDAQGRYAFTDVAAGRYNLEAMNPSDGTRARLAGIDAGGSPLELETQTLGMPGSIAAALEGAADTVTGFIYLPGSTFRAPVRASAAVVRLDSLPPGPIDSLVYGSASGAAPRAFAWNLTVLPSTQSPASGPFLAWRRFATLLVDGGPAGAKLSADVSGVPVRIVLPDSILATANKDGSDLRVANDRGDSLPCEVQMQDGAPAAIWVRMDTVHADRPTSLRLYWNYGGSDPLPAAKAGSVFSPADGFAGAWHLDEDPAAANGRLTDATGQGNDGVAVGYAAAGATESGVAGGALKFDGKTQYMGTRRAFDDPEAFTVLIWFRAGHSQGGRIFEFADKSTDTAAYWDRLAHIYKDGSLHYGVYPPDSAGHLPPTKSSYRILGTAKAYDDGAWHQLAVRLSPDEGQAMFVDGTRIGNDPSTHTAQIIKGYWRLGWGLLSGWAPSGNGEYFQGSLDEFWAVHSALADDFVKLSYENLKPGSSLIRWP